MCIRDRTKIIAPLFLIPAEFKVAENTEAEFLNIAFEQRIINPAIFQIFDKNQAIVEELKENLSVDNFDISDLNLLSEIFKEFSSEIDISELENFTKLFSEKPLKALLKSNQGDKSLKVVPAFAAFIMSKSKGSRGVINELASMSQDVSFSLPIKKLFIEHKLDLSTKKEILSVPIILSQSQKNVLQTAYNYDLSLVIGPPGTGKSFTIAALAVEFMTKGKTVLIASRNNQAGKVIADKIENDFGLAGIPVRAGKTDYKKQLQKKLENWLNEIGVERVDNRETYHTWDEILDKEKIISEYETRIEQLSKKEVQRGDFLANYTNGFFQKIKMYFLEREVIKEPMLWELVFELEQKLEERNSLFRKYIKLSFHGFVRQTLDFSRTKIQRFIKALKARTGAKKEAYFDKFDFSKILNALPIWVTCATDIHQVLPLEKELFDLVIIDEATQCDIASSLPLLQRGKKAVIVGDPKQLRHISFVSGAQLDVLKDKNELREVEDSKLDYRNSSILDLVSESIINQKQVSFLNEHFRSMPDIIDFSNQKFYEKQLHIMTAHPKTLCRQHAFPKSVNGKRAKAGYNKIEAEAIIDFLSFFFKNESTKNRKPISIGITSPFADQIAYLQKIITETFSLETLQKHNFLIGTPFSFQGEEKDIMLISLVLDDSSHPSAFQYLNREDVFNVCITRARTVQYVYCSFDPQKWKGNLAAVYFRYLEQFENLNQIDKPIKVKDNFLQDVLDVIEKAKLDEVLVSFPIAGIEIDLVVIKNDKTYCIDLIGHPGHYSDALTLERWRMLERVGLRTFFLPYSQWYFDQRKCQKALFEFLEVEMLLISD